MPSPPRLGSTALIRHYKVIDTGQGYCISVDVPVSDVEQGRDGPGDKGPPSCTPGMGPARDGTLPSHARLWFKGLGFPQKLGHLEAGTPQGIGTPQGAGT